MKSARGVGVGLGIGLGVGLWVGLGLRVGLGAGLGVGLGSDTLPRGVGSCLGVVFLAAERIQVYQLTSVSHSDDTCR